MLATADLHIHSPYSIAVSRFMKPEQLIKGCVTKGIRVLGTGDALQPAQGGPRLGQEVPCSSWGTI